MDRTESIRRLLVADINAEPGSREALTADYGQVWSTAELQQDFAVRGFAAPFVIVTRLSDGQAGCLVFQHSPRYYFDFTPTGD